VTTRASGRPHVLRVAGTAFISLVFFLEGACASGGSPRASSRAAPPASAAAPPSSPSKEISSSVLTNYESARAKAWDPSRRFKALFKAEVSPRVGAIGRGYLSVWWDGRSGSLEWRASAPIAGGGRGGFLRRGRGEGGEAESVSPVPGHLAAPDLIACILGTPDVPPSSSTLLDDQPGAGVPRRIEANGPDGRAVLVLESYGPWPFGEKAPPL
jgi:hypothetical protein